jgi:putative ABC transport system permease protein
MTRHLLKLIWNRKKNNALVVLEIFISFVVVFAVFAAVAVFAGNYRRPLGFEYQNVLAISVELPGGSDQERGAWFESLLGVLRSHPGVDSAAGVMLEPYFEGRHSGIWDVGGQRIEFDRNYATDDFARVMGLRLVDGRWFGREDDGAAWRPVVLDRDFARTLYGTERAVGREFDQGSTPPYRVVGVIEDYRAQGEYSPRGNYVFHRASPGVDATRIMARLHPGAYGASFENHLLRALERAVPGASFVARPLAQARQSALRTWITPVIIGALVGAFLILMVALGLTGVMWQNVTQRTRELGLRRALGAARGRIRRQIVAEIVLIASLGIAAGIAVVIQVPLMGLTSIIEGGMFAVAVSGALVLIYALAVTCGLYPSWLASRVEPAEALHYE